MTREPADSLSSADRLGAVLAACIEAVDRGDADAETVIARYPEYVAELREFFAAEERAARLAAPLQSVLQAPQTVSATDAALALPNPLGDFRLLREVGRGGMGVVYEAEQMSLGRRVALKVLPMAAAVGPRGLQRFQNEARAAAGLHHTNIAPVYAVGSERGVPYYAMQFIDGQTLSAIVAQLRRRQGAATGGAPGAAEDQPTSRDAPAGPPGEPAPEAGTSTAPLGLLSTPEGLRGGEYYRIVAGLGVQAAEALDCAHQLGVVHRDVKPANLMVGAGGHLWVTDFGLARMQADASITATGDLVGTLRYMSPESAAGGATRVVIDHRTDVYSLGATLYELLTLRPVFPGTDRQEVLRQIAFDEPPPLRRLNRAVPAELEVVVLKALEKSPADRYATAQDLADDLRRWLDDRSILARRPSWARVAARWSRRHKPLVGAALTVLLMAAALGGGTWMWWAQKRAGAEGEARAALREAAGLLEEERWPEALSAARRAEGVMAGVGADPGLRRQARTLVKDLEMARRLQEARLQGAATGNSGDFDSGAADAAYAAAFQQYGLEVDGLDPQEAAGQIRARPIHAQLAAALDHWALARQRLKADGWKQRLAVARAIDPDVRRNRLRDFVESKDRKVLDEVVAATPAGDGPVPTLQLLGMVITRGTASGERLAALLAQAQQRHPDDFWINETLGVVHYHARPPRLDEAIRYLTAAVALRPQSPGAHLNLGTVLDEKDQLDEAIAEFHAALRLNKDYAAAHSMLGQTLRRKGRLDEGIDELQEALRLVKIDPETHCMLANALADKGRLEEAISEHREALRLKPDLVEAHINLGNLLLNGHVDEAIAEYREGLRLRPDLAAAHNNLGIALRSSGQVDEAIAAYRECLRLEPDRAAVQIELGALLCDQKHDYDGAIAAFRAALRLRKDDALAHRNLGNALQHKGLLDEAIAEYRTAILLKVDGAEARCGLALALRGKGQLDEAVVQYREAIRLKPDLAEAHINLGALLCDEKHDYDGAIAVFQEAIRLNKDNAAAHYNLAVVLGHKDGQLDDAIAEYHAAIRLKADHAEAHCNLGKALVKKGQFREAVEELRRGHELGSRNQRWPYPSAKWLRQAEGLADLDARLPEILNGKVQPKDAPERLALARVCQQPFKALFAASARFYAEAFAEQAPLADDLNAGHRYNAACVAARAGCGQGKDADKLDTKQRAGLRKQALDWLRADAKAYRQMLDKSAEKAGTEIAQRMQQWLQDTDFSGVRGPEALGRLPEAERGDWHKLWEEVAALRQGAAKPAQPASRARP
ncbi:MAG: tetratricopeptide repeat protein [Isosphaeraceae bacterium]